MSVDRSYISENKTPRPDPSSPRGPERCRAGAPNWRRGWTIAGVLGHLAFWDAARLILARALEKKARRRPRTMREIVDLDQ